MTCYLTCTAQLDSPSSLYLHVNSEFSQSMGLCN